MSKKPWARFHRATSRRTFLKGLGLGAGGALLTPYLNMLEAHADGVPAGPRVVIIVEGNGFAGWNRWDRLTQTNPTIETLSSMPRQVASWDSRRANTLLLNGLANKQGGGIMAGHRTTYYPLTCMPYAGGGRPGGISIDEHLARVYGGSDIFPAIRLGAAAGDFGHGGLRSVTSAGGVASPLPTQHDPVAAFQELFGVVAGGDDGSAIFTENRRMLDYMAEDIRRVIPRLGPEERWKMERYLYSVETFQVRQDRLSQHADFLRTCATMNGPEPTENWDVCDRAEAQFALGTQALICGLTRVLVMGIATGPYALTTFGNWGFGGRHTMGHGGQGGLQGLADTSNRIAGLAMEMANALDAVPEGNGTMFDNTLFIFLNDNGDAHHSKYDNYPAAILAGQHITFQTGGRLIEYPNHLQPNSRGLPELWNAVCHAVGQPKDDFAKEGNAPSNGPLPEVLV